MNMERRQIAEGEDLDSLISRVHRLGREIAGPAAAAVDRDARFPSEGVAALKEMRLLSALVPVDLGGMGLDVGGVARICEALGQYCGSLAMVYAMHQIQVACLLHHGSGVGALRGYIGRLSSEQRLIASATSEVGTGGDLRKSVCAVKINAGRFEVTKNAPVISYGAEADDILLTCRRSADAPPSDQVMVLASRDDSRLQCVSGWDTLGFRGTCSSGFELRATGPVDQILPVPFADILNRTMHPFSHIVWGALWLGIAGDAVRRARGFVRAETRHNPGMPTTSALRLAEVDAVLQSMRSNIYTSTEEYCRMLSGGEADAFGTYSFAIRTNNLKLSSSTQVVEIVSRSLLVCGITGYRNDSRFSLCRHLRDAYGAALMVNNDRIMNHNASMMLTQREG